MVRRCAVAAQAGGEAFERPGTRLPEASHRMFRRQRRECGGNSRAEICVLPPPASQPIGVGGTRAVEIYRGRRGAAHMGLIPVWDPYNRYLPGTKSFFGTHGVNFRSCWRLSTACRPAAGRLWSFATFNDCAAGKSRPSSAVPKGACAPEFIAPWGGFDVKWTTTCGIP